MKFQNIICASVLVLFASHAFALSDAEIAEIVMMANKAEVESGKMAKSKAADGSVKAFADEMVTAHQANEKEGKKVTKEEKIKAKSTAEAKDLKKSAKDTIADLRGKKGIAFDRAYIENQIAMHQQLLNDLDQKFIPQAKNAQFKTFLMDTKTHVEEHLAKAKEIQTTLMK